MRISFNDSATAIFEYPSEQSLLAAEPPKPGYYDYPISEPPVSPQNGEPDVVEPVISLKSTPGMGSGGKYRIDRLVFSPPHIYLPLCKVADAPFYIQGDVLLK